MARGRSGGKSTRRQRDAEERQGDLVPDKGKLRGRIREFVPASKQLPNGMSESDLSLDLLALIDKYKGAIRTVVRDPSGAMRLLAVVFGPKTHPSYALEIKDFHNPEDPLQRNERLREATEKAHERRREEVALAVKEALLVERAESGTRSAANRAAGGRPAKGPVKDQERWSKRSFADAVAKMLGAEDSPLSGLSVAVDNNVIDIQVGDQRMKLTISMPRG